MQKYAHIQTTFFAINFTCGLETRTTDTCLRGKIFVFDIWFYLCKNLKKIIIVYFKHNTDTNGITKPLVTYRKQQNNY